MVNYVSNYTALLYSSGSGADTKYTNYGGDFRGSPVFITYSFLTDYEASKESKIYGADYYKGYTSAQKAIFKATIADLEASSSIKFIEVDDPKYAAIKAYVAYGSDVGGWGSVLGATRDGTSNGVNVTDARGFSSLSRAKQVIAHELGHNVGLKHPHEGDIRLNSSVDNNAHTIMSYKGSGFNGNAPYQEYDKDAFNFLYGSDINFSSRLNYSWSDASGRFTVTGSSGGDKIYGVDAYNSLYGGYGNDSVMGRDFADYLYGGNNNDRVYGGGGNDTLYGGQGNDSLYGDYGTDVLYGDVGDDRFYAGTGDGTDRLYGGEGDDRFYAGTGSRNYYGGGGKDTLSYAESSYGATISLSSVFLSSVEQIEGSKFNDRFYGDNGANYFLGLGGDDYFYGSGGNDVIFGGAGADRVYGGSGDDWMGADGRSDYFDGGIGVDAVTYYGASSGVYRDLRKTTQYNGDTLISVENLNGSNKGNDTLIGNDVANKFWGQGGNDRLSGEAGNDVLYGGSGRDYLYGGDGDDWMGADGRSDYFNGGSGVDTVTYYGASSGVYIDLKKYTQSNGDTLISVESLYGSNKGNDLLIGNGAANKFWGHGGNDRLWGDSGNDVLYGGGGRDSLYGGTGDDWMGSDGSYDYFDGGIGVDTVTYYGASSGVYRDLRKTTQSNGDTLISVESLYGSNKGNDTLIGNGVANKLTGNGGNDRLYGDAGNDYVYGGTGKDYLYGGTGDDWMGADGRSDYFDGGTGVDTVTYYGASSGVYIDLKKTTQSNGDTLISVENLYGSNKGNDWLFGNGVANKLTGNGGDDRLWGDSGNDVLYGGTGKDYLYGGTGDDWMGSDGSYDYFDGGSGVDTVTYYGASSGVYRDLRKTTQSNGDTLISVENLYGSNKGNDTLIGNDSANKFWGHGGNDRLSGEAGNDVLYGGSGKDYLFGGDGDDWMSADGGYNYFYGGSGVDTVTYSAASSGVYIDLKKSTQSNGDMLYYVENLYGSNKGNDWLFGNGAANKLVGNGGDDRLSGDAGNDVLFGGSGKDYLYGGDGDDWMGADGGSNYFYGGSGVDAVTYYGASSGVYIDLTKSTQSNGDILYSVENLNGSNKGNDTLIGNDDANKFWGHVGNDSLFGGAGNDTLYGGSENDTLDGGAGDDICYGDAGADVFVFKANYGSDTISDFQDNSDKIRMEAVQSFDDLTLTSVGDSTSIDYGSGSILLSQINQDQVTQSDFLFA